MVSPRQRKANQANALRSTGPSSADGKRRAKLNATKHGLSVPIDEHLYADQIQAIVALIEAECDGALRALEMAKRIIDFERNEALLADDDEGAAAEAELSVWAAAPTRMQLLRLLQRNQKKLPVEVTLTVPQKPKPVTLKGEERRDEIKFLKGFLRLQETSLLHKVRAEKNKFDLLLRYQKRSINQLVKGVRIIASGEEF